MREFLKDVFILALAAVIVIATAIASMALTEVLIEAAMVVLSATRN